MNRLFKFLMILIVTGITLQIRAENKEKQESRSSSFDRLKTLIGKWEATEVKNDGKKEKVYVNYKLTSGGTVIQETLFPHTPHEMVSIYYTDDEDLVMTHYCMIGNQPHLRFKEQKDPNKMVFEFVDATNLKSSKDRHMHGLTIIFLNKNHIQEDWVGYNDGKQCDVKTLKFSRVK